MIILSPYSASTLSNVTSGHSWVMFVQVMPPIGAGPIKIEGVTGELIAQRLDEIARDNPFDVFLIGLLPVDDPEAGATSLHDQLADAHRKSGWFEPTIELLAFIQQYSQPALEQLMGGVETDNDPGEAVDLDEIARVLHVSTKTVKRLVADRQIPHYKVGKQLRFVVSEVLGAMARR